MSFVSFAQNFEDVLLWRALGHVESGRYLDIGAQDPIVDSVSKGFHLAGWKGIHVEPTPAYAAALRADRPEDMVIQAAIGEDSAPITFYEVPDTGLSTGIRDIAQRHVEQDYAVREIQVPVLPLDQLLDRIGPGDIQWMKIDVEGMEPTVLRSWHDHPARPWIVLVESTFPNTQIHTHDEWIDLILGRGYHEVYFDGLSRYFIVDNHRELDAAFVAPPNIFDDFNVAAHHFSAKAICEDHGLKLEALRTAMEAAVQSSDIGRHEAEGAKKLLEVQLQDERERGRRELEELRETLAVRREETARTISALEASLAEQRQIANDRREAEQALRHAASQAERQWRATLEWAQARLDKQDAQIDALRQLTIEQDQREAELRDENDQLLGELSCLEGKAAQSDELIRRALAEPVPRWQRLGRVLGIAGEDRARQVLQSWTAQDQHCNVQTADSPMNVAASQEIEDYYRAASLAELLAFDGANFIHVAYATILGREPDPTGETFYLNRLGRGVPKIQIIDELSRSPEARLFPDPLPNLNQDLRRFRLASIIRGKMAAATETEKLVIARSSTSHVNQFMRYYDEEFVRIAFKYYLEREPDEAGLSYYTAQIRSGTSRQQVLLDIARSEEARLHGNSASGERSLAISLAIERIPIVGALFAAVRFNVIIRQHLRDVRAMQNHLYRLTQRSS